MHYSTSMAVCSLREALCILSCFLRMHPYGSMFKLHVRVRVGLTHPAGDTDKGRAAAGRPAP